jgi:hypothetical protein
MWMLRGEMAPQITRVQVVLASQAVTYTGATSLAGSAPTPPTPPTPTPPGPPVAPPS